VVADGVMGSSDASSATTTDSSTGVRGTVGLLVSGTGLWYRGVAVRLRRGRAGSERADRRSLATRASA
jgi:hypothetical protein